MASTPTSVPELREIGNELNLIAKTRTCTETVTCPNLENERRSEQLPAISEEENPNRIFLFITKSQRWRSYR